MSWKLPQPILTAADVNVIREETVYRGYFSIKKFTLKHRLFDGDWSQAFQREVFERGHAVGVLLYDPILNKMVLIEQFRVGTLGSTQHPWLLEIVAGIIDEDETTEQVAKREVSEEAGLKILDLIPIYNYWVSPGGSTEQVTLYCGRVDATNAQGIFGLADEDENIRVHVLDVKEVYDLLANGKINNALAIIAVQWFQLNEEKIKQQWKK